MSSFPISKAVTDRVFDRLVRNSEGFNETFNRLAVHYGTLEASDIVFQPATGTASPNFARANVSLSDWLKTSATRPPLVTLFSARATNTNEEKYMQFSGPVIVGLNVFATWRDGKVINFESTANCYEETVFTIFNRARNADPGDQDWGDLEDDGQDVVYNGDLDLQKSRVERGDKFWTQLLSFTATFEVHSRGEV